MRNRTVPIFPIFLLFTITLSSACAKKEEPLKPLDEIRSEAQAMSLEELRQVTWDIVVQILDGKEELRAVEAQYDQLSQSERPSRTGELLNQKAGELRAYVNARAERYHIYAAKIRELGEEPPKFKDVLERRAQGVERKG